MSRNHLNSILRYLADLAPTGSRQADVVHRTTEFAYLGWRPLLFQPGNTEGPRTLWRRGDIQRLTAIDSLHDGEELLRLGWLFVTGTIEQEGKSVRHCFPLLSVPVKVQTLAGLQYHFVHRGDVEMPDAFFDDDAKLRLESAEAPWGGGVIDEPDERLLARMPKLVGWVREAVAAAGLPEAQVVAPKANPLGFRSQPGLRVVPGAALYTTRDVIAPNVAGTLLGWLSQPLDLTAFDALYAERPVAVPQPRGTQEPGGWLKPLWRFQRRALDVFYGSPAPADEPWARSISTTLPLNARQREAIERSRREAITVVSGPPGTGKSHLVAAVAIDEIARGNSVLIATQSTYASDVIVDLLDRHQGPRYVRFGSRDSRESAAADLGDGLAQPLSEAEYTTRLNKAQSAQQRTHHLRTTIARLLEREADFAAGLRSRELNLLVSATAPGVLEEKFDLAAAIHHLAIIDSGKGLLAGWRRRRSERYLRDATRAEPGSTVDDLRAALDAADEEAAIKRGLVGGGLSLEAAWNELESAEAEYRRAIGEAIEGRRRARRNSTWKSARAVGELASALRAGRVKRRQILRELSGSDFLDVLPLWIGTLQEIDNTLPVASGMFDVVIFDEASQIDQMRAAPALARARRAIVVGDPRQLRHVSFVSDQAMEESASRNNLPAGSTRILDVRRNSLFDAAAAASPITWLDEHFRSVPHLISFSDRAFYSDNLRLMTQHPAVETQDAIHTVTVSGTRDGDGVNRIEVTAVLDQVQRLGAAGYSSIGVVSPFRAQADAIEEAVLAVYGPEDVLRLGLRVGTVHAFQGNERDIVIASLAIGPDDVSGSLRFLQDPNLFNVLITRARKEMIVVTSVGVEDLSDGLLGQYLRHAERSPHPLEAKAEADGWKGELLAELRRFRIPVAADYPVAGWTVDLAVGEDHRAFGVECRVHPDGPETHIAQHLALRRAGWKMFDAFQSRWLADPDGAAEMLSQRLLRRSV